MLRCRAMKGQVRRVALAVALGRDRCAGLARGRRHRRRDGAPPRNAVPCRADVRRRPGDRARPDGGRGEPRRARRRRPAAERHGPDARSRRSSIATSTRSRPTVADGEDLAASIQQQSDALREQLQALPGIGPGEELRLSAEMRARHARASQALSSTDGLSAAWSRLAVGSVAATRITVLLTEHDLVTADAAALGSDRQIRRRRSSGSRSRIG